MSDTEITAVDEVPQTTQKPGRKLSPIEIVAGIIFTLLVLVAVTEHIAYDDSWSCPSTGLLTIDNALTFYMNTHAGALPADAEEAQAFLLTYTNGRNKFDCEKTHTPFIWFPADIKTTSNDKLIVMCPRNSHGLLRKFAWGLAQKGKQIEWVRITKSGAVVPTSD